MKRYLIAVTIISVLVSGLLLGCGSEPASTKPPITTPTPKVIKKDVEIKYDVKERDWLLFYLKVGDRVEGEVSIDELLVREPLKGAYIPIEIRGYVGSLVKDPYGNIVVQNNPPEAGLGYPWRFAFIAYTDGEYKLGVYPNTLLVGHTLPLAHLKIIIHEGD